MLKPASTFVWIAVLSLLGAGCASQQHQIVQSPRIANSQGIIFAVDGAGGFHATSDSLRRAVQSEGLPLEVESVEWSHGYCRVLSDEMDAEHARGEGQKLAARIAAWRETRPEAALYIVAHSAGSLVALTAAAHLPPNAITRIVLLAPSVSCDYDLRPGLCCARDGIDVFFSERDYGYLGIGVAIIGTADRRWSVPAAGREGFHIRCGADQDASPYLKLRQHRWDPSLAWTGNNGGHYDDYRPVFLQRYVLPLFMPAQNAGNSLR